MTWQWGEPDEHPGMSPKNRHLTIEARAIAAEYEKLRGEAHRGR